MISESAQALLFVALPYAAFAVFVAGVVWRYRSPLEISARSSQIAESIWLARGTIPFHTGLALLLAGHLAPLLFPRWWFGLVSRRGPLLAVETAGMTAALLCLGGLLILLVRRLTSDAVRASSRGADVLVLLILIAQVALGTVVATAHRWGSIWSAVTLFPYLRSLIALRPDVALVAGMPIVVTLHLTGAWIVLALIPFTRLVHVFSLPLGYLGRRAQKVVWVTPRPA